MIEPRELNNQVVVPVPNGTVPFSQELKVELSGWMHKVEQIYLSVTKTHVQQAVPADILARQMEQLAKIFHRAEAAYVAGIVGDLEQCFNDIKYFNEPVEARAYYDHQSMQRDRRLTDKTQQGNR